jgi:hypothetical protein
MPIVRHYSFYRGFARSGFMALTFRSPLLFIPAPRMFQSGDRCCDPTRTVSDGLLRLGWNDQLRRSPNFAENRAGFHPRR